SPSVDCHRPHALLSNSMLVTYLDALRRVFESLVGFAAELVKHSSKKHCKCETSWIGTLRAELESCIARSERGIGKSEEPERAGALALKEDSRVHSVHRVIRGPVLAIVESRGLFAVFGVWEGKFLGGTNSLSSPHPA